MEAQQINQLWMSRDWRNWQPSTDAESLCQALEAFPAQLDDAVMQMEPSQWIIQRGSNWSVQEHVGHLLAMESLWIARIDDFVMGHAVLRPWNGHNEDVRMAQFNAQKMRALLRDFTATRYGIVSFLREIWTAYQHKSIRLERLDREFSLLEHMAFIHEHDQHHLRTILTLSRT